MNSSTTDNGGSKRQQATAAGPVPPTLLANFVTWLRSLAGTGDADLRESVEEVLDEHADHGDAIDPEQREMLLNILNFGELIVDDVMVPRADIIAVDVDASLDEVYATFRRANHSRLPVYRGTLDEVLGFVHIKDVIQHRGPEVAFSLEVMIRQPLMVPDSMPVANLLMRMRSARIHMAIVVDEYGGVDGLVTIEDVVEEIIGEIEDEHDAIEGSKLIERPDGAYEADGRVSIKEFEELVGYDLLPDEGDEEVDTLGGLIFTITGRVPRRGEVVHHDCGLDFEILDADPRRVKRLLIRRAGRTPSIQVTSEGESGR